MKAVVEQIRQSIQPFLGSNKQSFEDEQFQTKLRREVTSIRRHLLHLGREYKPVLAEETLLRLARMNRELKGLVQERVRFDATETWRAAYQDTLCNCKTRRYLSVALVRDDVYWRDTPGQKSIELNTLLVQRGFYLHRILIIEDFFWPRAAKLPSTKLNEWIMGQYLSGIQIGLVRLTDLDDEPDLVRDFGIYGHDAVGYQHADTQARTERFELLFDESSLRTAEDRWRRLSLYSIPYERIQQALVKR